MKENKLSNIDGMKYEATPRPKRTVKTSGSIDTPAKSSSPPTKLSKTGKSKPSGNSKANKKRGITRLPSFFVSVSPTKDDVTSTTVLRPYSTLSSNQGSSKTTPTNSLADSALNSSATTPIQRLKLKLLKPRFAWRDVILVIVLVLLIRYLAEHLVINWR